MSLRFKQLINDGVDLIDDFRLGIRTTGVTPSLGPSTYEDNEEYRPTTYRVLYGVFEQLDIRPDDRMVDYGCGLGRVVCVAAQKPFASVVGVELDPDLARRGQDNLRRLRQRVARSVEIVCASALDYDCSDDNLFYFYNPFGSRTLAGVVDRIRGSMGGRHIRIVFSNCATRPVLDETPWLAMTRVLRTNRQGEAQLLLYETR